MVELFHLREKGHMLSQVKHNLQLNPPTQCTCSLPFSLALVTLLIQPNLDQCDELVNTKDSDLQIFGEILLTSLSRTSLVHPEIVMIGDGPTITSCLRDSKLCPVVISKFIEGTLWSKSGHSLSVTDGAVDLWKPLTNLLFKSGLTRSGSSRPCPVQFWASPNMEIPRPLWPLAFSCLSTSRPTSCSEKLLGGWPVPKYS